MREHGKDYLPSRTSAAVAWAPFALRLIVGYGFLAHGFAKLSRGPDVFGAILHAMGVPAATGMAWLTILVEVFGGLAVLLGALVPFASAPMAAVLLVAMFTVHLPYGFSSVKLITVTPAGAQFGPPGYEVDLLYLACLAVLVMGGPGPFAVDTLIRRRRERRSLPQVSGRHAAPPERQRRQGPALERRPGTGRATPERPNGGV